LKEKKMAGAKKTVRLTSPEALLETISAFRLSRIILTAFELEVFSILGGKKSTSAYIAKLAKTDPRGMDRLLNALCALGLLKKKNGNYANTTISKKFLTKGQPNFLAGLGHSADLWNRWSTLTQAVIKGGTVIERSALKRKEKRLQGFIAAMHERASAQADETIKWLDLTEVYRTLDIGGGSGAYSIALVRAKKDIRATVFDLADVIPLTRTYVKKSGVASQIDFIEGDFNRDDFGFGYDLILLSAIIHMNSLQKNLNLFKKAVKAINPGGQLVIQDYFMSEDRIRPAPGAFFALNMLVGTEAGDTYTEREVRRLMKEAGFSKIAKIKTPFAPSLMIGRKKGKILSAKRRQE
jgi:SAM-dependent methyltransferase